MKSVRISNCKPKKIVLGGEEHVDSAFLGARQVKSVEGTETKAFDLSGAISLCPLWNDSLIYKFNNSKNIAPTVGIRIPVNFDIEDRTAHPRDQTLADHS